jgi:hypothetical protein
VTSIPNTNYEYPPHIQKQLAALDDPDTDQGRQRIHVHFAEVCNLEQKQRYWATRSDIAASDAEIKEAKLTPIQNRLNELAEERMQLRGDFVGDSNEAMVDHSQVNPTLQLQIPTNGTIVVWTPERKLAAKLMLDREKAKGTKAYAATTAKAFGVSPARLRAVLGDSSPKKKAVKDIASTWHLMRR